MAKCSLKSIELEANRAPKGPVSCSQYKSILLVLLVLLVAVLTLLGLVILLLLALTFLVLRLLLIQLVALILLLLALTISLIVLLRIRITLVLVGHVLSPTRHGAEVGSSWHRNHQRTVLEKLPSVDVHEREHRKQCGQRAQRLSHLQRLRFYCCSKLASAQRRPAMSRFERCRRMFRRFDARDDPRSSWSAPIAMPAACSWPAEGAIEFAHANTSRRKRACAVHQATGLVLGCGCWHRGRRQRIAVRDCSGVLP
jgi:hypothetical protein